MPPRHVPRCPASQARKEDPTFKYGFIMVDKARNEIAAIKQLVSTGDAMGWLLCYFHFLQEWERFLRSAESGVVGKEAQHRVLRSLAHLVHVKSERMFKEKVGANSWPAAQHLPWLLTLTLPCLTHPMQLSAWYCDHVPYPAVVRKMLDHWQGCAEHWAWWGRLDVLGLGANTNNLVERFFGLLKYVHLERSTQHTLQRLVNVLLERVVPAAMQRRRQALAGRGVASDQQQREQRQRKYVQELAASGAVSAAPPGSAPGLTSVRTSEEHVTTTCVGDLSCSCEFSGAWRWEWAGSGACAWRRRQACAALLAPSFHPAPHPCWHPPGQRTPCART